MNPKVRKYYNLAARICIGILAYTLLFRQVFSKGSLIQLSAEYQNILLPLASPWLIAVLLLLMLLNWALEACKWKLLIASIEKIKFLKALRGVLAGITLSFFTPNRAGEFLGRIFILEKARRVDASILTISGSLAQFFVTLLAGGAGLILFLLRYTSFFDNTGFSWIAGMLICWTVFSLVFIYFFLNLKIISGIGLNIKILRSRPALVLRLSVLALIPKAILLKALLFSIARYMVFSLQAIFLLHILSKQIPFLDAAILTSVFFLVVTLIPSFALADLGIRGSAAAFLFEFFAKGNPGQHTEVILPAILSFTLLWFVNIAIPALLGVFGLAQLRFFRETRT